MTRLVWQAGMAVGLSEFCEPAGIPAFGYEATTAGIAGTHEPTWPTTAGTTVNDGTIVWTARAATIITWTARALYKTGASEPVWPTTVGDTVSDNGITWTTITPAITDSKCPQSKIAFAIQHKIYSPDRDVTRYCATDSPRDWSTQDDAGFFASGLNSPSSPYVTAIGEYRGRLAVWTAGGLQIWTPDPDPANITLFDTIDGIGTSYSRSQAAVAGDLYFLSHAGVRSLSIAAGANTLESGDVGAPIDSIVKAMAAAGDDAIGSYYPGFGQYWLTFTPARPVISQITPFPDTCNDVDYSHAVALSGGSGVYYQASLVGGTYPPGTSLNIVDNQLTIEFFNADAGTYHIYVTVTDSLGVTSAPFECVIVVHDFQITGTLTGAVYNTAYSGAVTLVDGVAPYGTPVVTGSNVPASTTATIVGNVLTVAWPLTPFATPSLAVTVQDATGCSAAINSAFTASSAQLLSGTSEYGAGLSNLALLSSNDFPATLPPYHDSVGGALTQASADGSVIAYATTTDTTLHICRWNGSAYVAMTITGSATAGAHQYICVSSDGAWVYTMSTSGATYRAYKYDGVGYTLMTTATYGVDGAGHGGWGMVLSPDGTQIAWTVIGFLYRYNINATTGALSGSTSASLGFGTGTVAFEQMDWVGNYIVGSGGASGARFAVYSATTLARLATTGETYPYLYDARFSADGTHIYAARGTGSSSVPSSVTVFAFSGTALTIGASYDSTSSSYYGIAINSARSHLIRANGVPYAIGGATLTKLTALPSFTLGSMCWTNR